MRRNILAHHHRRASIERLEVRALLSAAIPHVQTNDVVAGPGNGTGNIYGTVFEDLNGNGIQDQGEPVVVGAQVYIDLNNSGALTGGDPQTVTDAFGGFGFDQLGAGTYIVRVVPEAGFSIPAPGYYSATVTSTNDYQILLVAESNGTSIVPATITGTVFNDVNGDNTFEPAFESFLTNQLVYADLNHDGTFDPGDPNTATNSYGQYSLTVPAGSYEIRVQPINGYHEDAPGYVNVTVAANSTASSIDLGESTGTTISGIVFNDLSGNGIYGGADTPVAGETVFISLDYSGAYLPGVYDQYTGGFVDGDPWTTTDANGNYSFADLSPGIYRVMIQSSAGMIQDGLGFVDVTVGQNQAVTQNLGEGDPVSIAGTVFNDVNGNSMLDGGEGGIPNQQVFVDLNDNGIFNPIGLPATHPDLLNGEPNATTDTGGNYTISDLGPGTYTLRSLVPAGATQTAPANSSDGYTMTIGSGQNLTGQNFGYKTTDLSISIDSLSTAPTTNGALQKAVVTVTNLGAATDTSPISVALWASVNTQINTSTDYIVGFLPGRDLNLKPGRSKTLKIDFSYPQNLTTGAYYVSAEVTSPVLDGNLNNNLTPSVGPIMLAQPYIDLALSFTTPPPVVVNPGIPATVDVTLTNIGTTVSTGNLTFNIYASSTAALASGETVASAITIKGTKLKPGQSKTFALTFRPGIAVGYRYVIVGVTTSNPLGDENPVNNIVVPTYATNFL